MDDPRKYNFIASRDLAVLTFCELCKFHSRTVDTIEIMLVA